jgi:hypothetical protein
MFASVFWGHENEETDSIDAGLLRCKYQSFPNRSTIRFFNEVVSQMSLADLNSIWRSVLH